SPLMTKRVVAKLQGNRLKRWHEIAKEAAQQSERLEIPKIDNPAPLDSFLEETRLTDMKFIFWEKAPPVPISPQIQASLLQFPNNVSLLIGPEGGWEKEEVDRAIEKGYIAVSLGERPIRAETAALAALAILQYEIGNVRKSP
ncbi:MAG: RNA methyltransferase, partial [Nitrospirae bacterium]|nr:RNA methyltransferase [Candidatus Troglogloeales bacterium]